MRNDFGSSLMRASRILIHFFNLLMRLCSFVDPGTLDTTDSIYRPLHGQLYMYRYYDWFTGPWYWNHWASIKDETVCDSSPINKRQEQDNETTFAIYILWNLLKKNGVTKTWIADGKLFHAYEAATRNTQSPKVDQPTPVPNRLSVKHTQNNLSTGQPA